MAIRATFRRQGEGRKAPSDPTFHPSRDEPHWIGDETASGQGVLLDQGEVPSRLTLFGAQGGSTPEGEWTEPENTSRLRPLGGRFGQGVDTELVNIARRSSVPVAHWTGARPEITVSNKSSDDAAGYYQHGRPGDTPFIAVGGAGLLNTATETMLHEMGHARHYEEVTNKVERDNPTKTYQDASGWSPDPLKEALADAYVDRYGGTESPHSKLAESHKAKVRAAEKMSAVSSISSRALRGEVPEPEPWSHISDRQFGYSSQYEAHRGSQAVWDDPDRVLYAGVRAHYDETGEHPRYQAAPTFELDGQRITRRGSSTDATIAMLHEHSPHARAAWESLNIEGPRTPEGMKGHSWSMADVAEGAVRRHKDRQLLSQGQEIQESLWDDPTLSHNQFGEVPRSVEDIKGSLDHEWRHLTEDELHKKLNP